MRPAPVHSILLAILMNFLVWVPASEAAVWHVDDDAPGGDGTSWAQAFRHLQDALLVGRIGDEIRVAAGSYRPDERSDWPVGGTGDRAATFRIPQGREATIRGGGITRPERTRHN